MGGFRMSRLLTNPLFWVLTFIVCWILGVTVAIANDPDGARAGLHTESLSAHVDVGPTLAV
jgi:hypothetical protein